MDIPYDCRSFSLTTLLLRYSSKDTTEIYFYTHLRIRVDGIGSLRAPVLHIGANLLLEDLARGQRRSAEPEGTSLHPATFSKVRDASQYSVLVVERERRSRIESRWR